MTEISQLRYIQWRPIGVCDSGEGRLRKAKIFSKADLTRITSPEIRRDNWRKNPKVMKIIQDYANEVAELSTLTAEMINPEISEIKLVGAVIDHSQTPSLNKESIEGRVQFFQVCFREGKTQKTFKDKWKFFFKWIGITFCILTTLLLIYLLFNFFSEYSLKRFQESVSKCGTNRKNFTYSKELNDIRKSLLSKLNRLPEWITLKDARLNCSRSGFGVNEREQILLDCFITVRNKTRNISYKERPNLKEIEECAVNLCNRNLKHLVTFCKRL